MMEASCLNQYSSNTDTLWATPTTLLQAVIRHTTRFNLIIQVLLLIAKYCWLCTTEV